MIEKLKQWFRRHSLAGHLVLLAVIVPALAWWWAGWPLHPYRLSEAVVMSTEVTGIHVVSMTEADGRIVMALASTTGENHYISQDYAVDYWRKGVWYQVLDSRMLVVMQPAVGYYPYIPANGTFEQKFRLENVIKKLCDRNFPAGQYRLRYYDGLYEFTLD